ncbi:MAG: hypothetical protein WD772_06385 [Pseudohongiellaceae bacterium]
MNQFQRFSWQQPDIRLYAVAASLLISVLTYLTRTTPNDDAFIYIRTAEIFLDDGLAAAFTHYQWAAYPVLIGSISRVVGIDLFSAAYLLNGLFYGVLVYAYLSIMAQIDSSRRVMLLAAVTLLVYPQFNEFRQEVIRDSGFWAFSLLALWQLILFGNNRSFRHIMYFVIAMLAATAMRIEALVYLLTVPVIFYFDERMKSSERRRFVATYLGLALTFMLVLYLILLGLGLNLAQLIFGFVSIYGVFVRDFLFPDADRAAEVAVTLFNDHAANYSSEYIALFMLTGLIAILLANLFNGIGGPYLIVLGIGVVKRFVSLPRHVALPMIGFMSVNLVILFVFVLITRYLTSRYTMLFCILLSMLVPLVLDRVLVWATEVKREVLVFRLVVFFLFYCAIDAYISFGENKSWVYDASDWIVANSDEDTLLVTNNITIAYQTGKVAEYELTTRNLSPEQIIGAVPSSVIAVELNYFMEQLLAEQSISQRLERVMAFPSLTEPGLVVYRRNTLP